LHAVATESVWQFICPKNSQVWFWSVTDVIKSVQETVVHFCNTVASVSTHTSHRSCDECWVTRVKFVISFGTSKFYGTKFQYEIINKFLDFRFCKCTTSKVTFCVNIKNDGHTSKRSSRTVNHTTNSHESNVCPLDSFFDVHRRSANIDTVKVTQFNDFTKGLVLQVNFFTKAN